MPRPRRELTGRLVAGAAGLVIAGTLTGCLGHGAPDRTFADNGPLVSGTEVGMDCVPTSGTGQATEAYHAIHVTPADQLTVKAVKLLNQHGFDLVRTYLVPITGTSLIGDSAMFPPPRSSLAQPGVHWGERVTIQDGSPIPTQVSAYNVVLHLKQTTATSGFDGIEIDYTTAGGKAYRWQGHFGLTAAAKCT